RGLRLDQPFQRIFVSEPQIDGDFDLLAVLDRPRFLRTCDPGRDLAGSIHRCMSWEREGRCKRPEYSEAGETEKPYFSHCSAPLVVIIGRYQAFSSLTSEKFDYPNN